MDVLLKAVAIWGIADALWLALNPAGWARFWRRFVGKAEQGGALPRVLALVELGFSVYLLTRKPQRGERGLGA